MNTESEKIELGKRVVLGAVIAEFQFANGAVLSMKRMGMSKEQLFTDLYKNFIAKIEGVKSGVLEKVGDVLSGAKTANFGVFEIMNLLGDLLGKVPEFQDILLDSVMLIIQANKGPAELTREYLKEELSTLDCFAVIKKAAEVQGLLASFRQLIGGLGALSQGEGRA